MFLHYHWYILTKVWFRLFIKTLKNHITCLLSLALNGGRSHFSLPVLALIFPACSLVLSHLLRDSLCTALQTEKLWIWSTGLSTQLTPSSRWEAWVLGNLSAPTERSQLGIRWTRGRVGGSYAALSVEDIEDIYLFGTMITGLLLIGLGFALGYRRIQKTGTAVQSLTRLPAMTEAVGRAVSIETETINRNMDSIMEKLTALQRKIDGVGDQNGQRE